MPENPLEQARFDHVDAAGELVFAVGNLQFSVSVDETLERAILEAKQIRSESERPSNARAGETLPISQIQSLIRAGADPSRVAERYGLSEALVRRFSAAVETEKQYAIEQFLTVPAPTESRMRTLAELIERTLASARIGMETLNWRATRRGLEPWRITAQFRSAGHMVKAEWTWNMHDNAVVCLNSAAKKLLGEQNLGSKGVTAAPNLAAGGDDFPISLNLPGDSIRSARIERAVSQWNAALNDDQDAGTPVPASAANGAPAASGMTDHEPLVRPSEPAGAGSAEAATSASVPPLPSSAATNGASAAVAAEAAGTGAQQQQPQTPDQTADKPKRRSGRSAVPSWDEILFGD